MGAHKYTHTHTLEEEEEIQKDNTNPPKSSKTIQINPKYNTIDRIPVVELALEHSSA